MAADFPAAVTNIARPTAQTKRNAPGYEGHALHNKLADEVEAIEGVIGVTGSTVPTSLEYRLANVQAVADAAADAVQVVDADLTAFQNDISKPIKTLTLVQMTSDNLQAQLGDGTWIGTDNTATGRYGGSLWFGTGSIGSLTKVEKTACRSANLLTKAGAAMPAGGASGVWGVWVLPNENFLFVANATASNKWYLYLAKNASGTVTVGDNSPTLNNLRPVLEIGEKSGTHIAGVNALHKRSLCVANIAGSTVLLFGEYNVNTSRTPGSTNDLVRVLKSTDMGETWTTLLEWNSNGTTRQVDHVHGIVQDDQGFIYILCGDTGKAAIFRWDGVSAAPAANSDHAVFNRTPGWAVIYGSTDQFRSCDLQFFNRFAAWLPDSNALTVTQLATRDGPFRIIPGSTYTGVAGHDPLISLRTPHGAIWFAMFTTVGFPNSPAQYDAWFQPESDPRRAQRIGKLGNFWAAATTQKLFDIYWSTAGQIIVTAGNGGESLVSGSVGGTAVFSYGADYSVFQNWT